jgi:hypothetical protein
VRNRDLIPRGYAWLVGAVALVCALTPAHADRALPAWYDQNAIATAPDWHYRVPINVPAASVNSTVEVNVDFAALLTQLNVNGTFTAEADGQIATTSNTPFSSIAFDSGNEFRCGRLTLENAFGSERIDLSIPIETQYYNSRGTYVTNVADNCMAIALNNVYLSSGTASGGATFTAGKGNLKIIKPLSKVSIDLCMDLDGATPTDSSYVVSTLANMPWLQWKWSGATFDNDPKARATFGVFKNADELVYLREVY